MTDEHPPTIGFWVTAFFGVLSFVCAFITIIWLLLHWEL